ncbi:Protein mab-21-like 2 [Pseudolycoriella hygida]|uniref:Protein mab-21-like 2 n=1 Tax=Pseudolycoriella hygida TaxID=35572 RepID=A0A9Q0MVQ6_9DIPT|nr:Protein mab-21-like 2 [Pseudolycoriella hygida]
MGKTQSKTKFANSFTTEESVDDKTVKKNEKLAAKKTKRNQKRSKNMQNLKDPAAPHVPKKADQSAFNLDYDAVAKQRMQDQLANDSQSFILNQLMLAVQFFEYYEKESWEAFERNRQKENEETNKIARHCKSVLLSDRLHEAVDRRVRFRASYGQSTGKIVSIGTQTMYVVHENIEVTNPGERSDYSILTEAPVYRMEIDNPTDRNRHTGYVRLRSTEVILNPNFHSKAVKDDESIEEHKNDEDSDDEEYLSKINPKFRDSILILPTSKRPVSYLSGTCPNNYSQVSSASTSSVTPDGSEYDYATITALNKRQPLSVVRSGLGPEDTFSTTTLPDICITNMPVASIGSDDFEDDETIEVKQFLNSKAFSSYFVNIFNDTLAKDFGMTKNQMSTATCKGPVIYIQPWEIVPAIQCPWPREAFEWMHRQREIKENPLTRQKFQWPKPDMVNKVVQMGCHVIPFGYAPKNGLNPHRELEWKIVFPEANRYLESCLTSSQSKIYLITKVLLQHFVEPHLDSKYNMFTDEHLRNHLFWQCENNFAAWPETYLGEALVRFLNSLLEHIKRQKLPDYYLPKRNLFENIPERIMVDLHKRIFRITENPLMYVLKALKSLKYLDDFGVAFNCRKLYTAITIDDPLKMLNKQLMDLEKDWDKPSEPEDDEEEDEENRGIIATYMKYEKANEIKRRPSRKVKIIEAEKLKQMEEAAKKPVEDFINLTFPIIRHMERIRRDIIYKIFIDHYLLWAKKTRAIKSYSLALIFLFQARRLASLSLDDDPMKDVSEKCEEIETLIESVLIEKNRDSQTKPRLPRRESYINPGSKALIRVKNNASKGEDPYTNIEGVPITGNVDSVDNIENVEKVRSPKFRKSILVSPGLNGHLARKNRTILKVQIHAEQSDAVTVNGNGIKSSPIMPRSFYSPVTPSSPLSMSTSPKKLKFFDNDVSDATTIPPLELANYISELIPTSKTNGFEPPFHANRKISVTSNVSEDHVTSF